MATLDSVHQKLFRCRHHFDELNQELKKYYEGQPGTLVKVEGGTPENPRFEFREKTPVPAVLGLICGDVLQCMRSSLDYLVWELVLADGGVPNNRNMFPIALTSKAYTDDVLKRKRLDGVGSKADALIEELQPFHLPIPASSPLAVLDELTNISKHRRVLLTGLVGTRAEPPREFPHMRGFVYALDGNGCVIEEILLWAYLALKDGYAANVEITVFLDDLARYFINEVMPLFEPIFA